MHHRALCALQASLRGRLFDRIVQEGPAFAFRWAVPAGILAGWVVYPALTTQFKSQIGLPNEPLLYSDIRYKEADAEEADLPDQVA